MAAERRRRAILFARAAAARLRRPGPAPQEGDDA